MTSIPDSADKRLSLLSIWAQQHLSSSALRIEPASEDASFRRYFRVTLKNSSVIAMDAPPEREPLAAFLDVAARLNRAGVAAPKVLASDEKAGFALLEDLGPSTYLQALQADSADADRLYGDAIHTLVGMQTRTDTSGLPPYDEALLRKELAIFRDWLLEGHLGMTLGRADAAAWDDTVATLVASALAQPRTFVHRDYHSRNLMLGQPGAPGVIDFQDAVIGPITYDIVSLLKDCYVAWPRPRIAYWWRQYLDLLAQTRFASAAGDEDALWRSFELMGMQRHLKASGIFVRLHRRDGKDGYLRDIPRTLGYVLEAAHADERFAWLHDLIAQRVLPAMTAA